MTRKPSIIFLALVISLAAEEMTYESYQEQLNDAKTREESALPKIAKLKTRIAALKLELKELREKSQKLWREILSVAGITQQEYDEFINQLDELKTDVNTFSSQYSEDLFVWDKAITEGEKNLAGLRKHKAAIIPRLEEHFTGMEQSFSDSRQAREQALSDARHAKEQTLSDAGQPGEPANSSIPMADTYTVREVPGDRDCLWHIAEKPEIFGDPERWPEIYRANEHLIKNPDLIFPGQVLTIPR
ncbi:hypothetical protein ACFL5V_02265 [Fibrobacterota bacterium]